MEEAESLYDDFAARIQVERWQELLSADVVWNVELKRTLSDRMADFLEERDQLPRSIWQLLEDNFGWRNQAQEEAYFGDRYSDFVEYLTGQLEGPELRFTFLCGGGGRDTDTFLRLRYDAFQSLQVTGQVLDMPPRQLPGLVQEMLKLPGLSLYQDAATVTDRLIDTRIIPEEQDPKRTKLPFRLTLYVIVLLLLYASLIRVLAVGYRAALYGARRLLDLSAADHACRTAVVFGLERVRERLRGGRAICGC
ncbi:hypothetical protein [Paenibacillus oceani]|uniref:hypothetical protein n=1 Tax=Paenibacillus oceani TaxID=2772510 RepID=UPI001CC25089|nr:hypothetical protein [Paenibacillus oceani]